MKTFFRSTNKRVKLIICFSTLLSLPPICSKEKGRVQVLPSPHRDAPPKSALLKLMDSDRALFVFEANSLPRQLMAWVVTDFSGIFSCSNERSSYNGEALKRHRP